MYGLTRGTITLIGAAAAGLLIWLATQIGNDTTSGYWAIIGLLAAAGLTMAFSQILGGWTKWGWPRISGGVFLIAFVPVAIAALWVILGGQPGSNWFQRHALSWAGDVGVRGLLNDLLHYIPVLAFGTGLVFGFTFDTTGPRTRTVVDERERVRPVPTSDVRAGDDVRAADEPLTAERTTTPVTSTTTADGDRDYAATTRTAGPDPEPPPRTGGPDDS